MAYATKAQLKEYADISVTDDDDLIDRLLAAAQAWLEKETRRKFEASSDSTRYLHPVRDVDGRTLWLDRDLASITSITNGDGTTVASTSYSTLPRNASTDGEPIYAIRLHGNSGVNWEYADDPDEDQIAIAGRWAYSTSADAEVVEATLELAKWLYRRKDAKSGDERPLLTGDGAMILPAQVPDTVKRFVQRRRFRKVRG